MNRTFSFSSAVIALAALLALGATTMAHATVRDEPNQCTVHDDGSRDFDNEGAARNYLQNNPTFTNNVSVKGGPNINNNTASAAATAMANGGAVNFWANISPEQRQALMSNQSFMGSLDANQRQALQNYSPSSSSSSLALQNAFSNYSPSQATIQGNLGGQSIGNYMEGAKYYNVSLGTANGAVELPPLPPTKANETFLCYAPGKIVNVPMEFAVTGRLGGVDFVRAEMDDGTRWYQSEAEKTEIRKTKKGVPNVLMTQEWEINTNLVPESEEVMMGNDKFVIKWGVGLIQRVVDVGAAINGQIAGSLFSKGDGGQISGGGGSNIQQTVMRLTPTGDSCIMNRTRYERWLKMPRPGSTQVTIELTAVADADAAKMPGVKKNPGGKRDPNVCYGLTNGTVVYANGRSCPKALEDYMGTLPKVHAGAAASYVVKDAAGKVIATRKVDAAPGQPGSASDVVTLPKK
jgi:hypothetical protein